MTKKKTKPAIPETIKIRKDVNSEVTNVINEHTVTGKRG